MRIFSLGALTASAAFVGGFGMTPPASAQPAQITPQACSERARIVGHLENKYGEVLAGAGLQGEDGVMELYVSAEGGWTLLLTMPNGSSCPIAVGESWKSLARTTPAPLGDPT